MKQGYADIVLGLQFGDEGKARVIDNLAKKYDIIARFNGGANAGHTIETEKGSIAVRQIPSGIHYTNITLYIGSGCAVNIERLAEEIQSLKNIGIDVTKRLKISSLASIIQPHHLLLDALFGKSIGTTKNGIGPSYADRAIRMQGEEVRNIRLADLVDQPKKFFAAILKNLHETQQEYKTKEFHEEETIKILQKAFEAIKPYIELDPLYMEKRVASGANVLFEGAQSTMLDVTKGSVPFVTSSNTIAAAAYTGGDLSPKYHRKTIGVIKAVSSRVGYGPFPPEFGGRKSEKYTLEKTVYGESKYTKTSEKAYDVNKLISSGDPFDVGVALRILSGEYGTATQRPRRVGMMDFVQLKHAVMLNGIDELVITKCDVLKEYSRTKTGKMPITVGYFLDNKKIDYVPGATSAFYRVKPIIKEYPGFSEDISEVRSFTNLPKQVKDFVKEVEKASDCKVVGLGVGPKREQYIPIK